MKIIGTSAKRVAVCLAAVVLLSGIRPTSAREAEFEVIVEKNVMVAMRDGTRLATDVYLPSRDTDPLAERLATNLTRTPYNKDGTRGSARYYAARGYAFVAQDTRGRYGSEGIWDMLNDDGRD